MLSARTGSSPSVIEVAEYLSIDTEQVIEALDAIADHHAASLDEPVAPEFAEDAGTRHDIVGGEDEGYALIETALSLVAASRKLPSRTAPCSRCASARTSNSVRSPSASESHRCKSQESCGGPAISSPTSSTPPPPPATAPADRTTATPRPPLADRYPRRSPTRPACPRDPSRPESRLKLARLASNYVLPVSAARAANSA